MHINDIYRENRIRVRLMHTLLQEVLPDTDCVLRKEYFTVSHLLTQWEQRLTEILKQDTP